MQIVATNKKAFQNFHLIEVFEAGIELKGTEVKSLRQRNVAFKDSFCRVKNGEVFLLNLHISPYKFANRFNHDPERPRKLLLTRREIKRIIGKLTTSGLTLIPTKIYFNNRGFAKVEIALARGKRMHDKREEMKRKEIEKKIREYAKYGKR